LKELFSIWVPYARCSFVKIKKPLDYIGE
jgi:hypothetical protein